ncbi:MAG: hypothetical protein KDK08_29480 [Rhizobiaceae bacterium]|nr:hypothetical protein [Rhizobiaceae bacterium]
MSAFRAPFTSTYTRKDGGIVWTFRRGGHYAQLPHNTSEPWYTQCYASSLAASGLTVRRVFEVLISLPHSLAQVIHVYRMRRGETTLAAGYRRELDDAAQALCDRFGWHDATRLSGDDLLSMARACPFPYVAMRVLRAAFRDAFVQGVLTVDPAEELELPEHRPPRGHTVQWADADLATFNANTAPGSHERVALYLMLHLGVRRHELLSLTPEHVAAPARRNHPELLVELAASPKWRMTHRSAAALDVVTSELGLPAVSKHALRRLNAARVGDVIAGVV